MKPLVSILIPAFNAQEWIADTIKSAARQTWPRKEIIVVDDGSRDQTLSIARQFASKEVSVVTQPNQGAAAARNQAFSICQGDYIQWLDADDLLAPDKIARQMEALDRGASKRTLLSSAWGEFVYRFHKADFVPTPLWCDLPPVEWLLRKMGENVYMQTATWLVSRELTEAAGPWNTQLSVDNDGEYFCRVLLRSDGTRFIAEARVFYRMSGFRRVSYIGRSERKMEALFHSMQLHIGYLRSLEDSERVRVACVKYLENYLPIFYPQRPDIVTQAEQIAATLGGRLEAPRLSRKYAWIQKSLGWPLARRAQILMPRCKWFMIRSWDKTMFRFEGRNLAGQRGPLRRTRKAVNARILKKWGSSARKKAIWDEEFSSGQWDYLECTADDPIYHWLEKYSNNGSILDLGCGSSNTGNELDVSKYCSYTGVDISEKAIQRAVVRSMNNDRRDKNEYFCEDMSSYIPRMCYDVILFRESLFYIPRSQIKGVLGRYADYLKETGVFIVRMCDRNKYDSIVRLIEKNHQVLDSVRLGNADILLVFRCAL